MGEAMLYQVTLLGVRIGTPQAAATIGEWVRDAPFQGRFLASWQSEFGVLNQVLLLQSYEDAAALAADREMAALSDARYGIGDGLTSVSTLACRPMAMFPPVEPGTVGPVFEVRSYVLRVGALGEMMERWEKVLPARMAFSKPLIVMHTMDGPGPRLIHIWPYASLEARDRIRAEAAKAGVWPVKGAPGSLLTQQSEIFLPGPVSPVR
jgi:hypothetical protein